MVALKIIMPGMDTKEIISGFEAERQTLGLLDHSNVAKLDAKATDLGSTYFVMELVKRFHITRFCDKQKLNTRERLRNMAKPC